MLTPEVVRKFYGSAKWKKARRLAVQTSRGICNRCGKAGWEVHHKVALTEGNITDVSIALSPDNLEVLCTACHNAARIEDRYIRNDLRFDKDGDVVER